MRGIGLGSKAHRDRLEKIKELGYNLAICTVVEKNTREIKILEKNGWKKVYVFTSSVSGHKIGLWVKDIRTEAHKDETTS
jgi:L-amino acid N-acyltransferase YncA